MEIALRLEPNGKVYIDKYICSETISYIDGNKKEQTRKVYSKETLSKPPYNYSFVEVDDMYADCQPSDFNQDLTFSVDKYNSRKLKTTNGQRIAELKQQLAKTDYQALKYSEGCISWEEYRPMADQRQAWRDEINRLEEEMK